METTVCNKPEDFENLEDKELYYRIFKEARKDLCPECVDRLIEWMTGEEKMVENE
jgi:hypothetical protein